MTENHQLATIRQAYRYVAAYERRVLDSLAELDRHLSPLGFEFKEWGSLKRPFPKRGQFSPRKWAWDNLVFYNVRLQWTHGGRYGNEAGNIYLFVDHVADTGFELHTASKGTEPDPLQHLPPSTECKSLLRTRWIKFDEAIDDKLWKKSWDKLFETHFGEVMSDFGLPSHGAAPQRLKEGEMRAGGFSMSIDNIRGPDDFGTLFVEPIVNELTRLLGDEVANKEAPHKEAPDF